MISPEQPPTWLRYGLDEAFRGCAFGKGVCAFGERGGGSAFRGVFECGFYAFRGDPIVAVRN